jgi:hypothetical protein
MHAADAVAIRRIRLREDGAGSLPSIRGMRFGSDARRGLSVISFSTDRVRAIRVRQPAGAVGIRPADDCVSLLVPTEGAFVLTSGDGGVPRTVRPGSVVAVARTAIRDGWSAGGEWYEIGLGVDQSPSLGIADRPIVRVVDGTDDLVRSILLDVADAAVDAEPHLLTIAPAALVTIIGTLVAELIAHAAATRR